MARDQQWRRGGWPGPDRHPPDGAPGTRPGRPSPTRADRPAHRGALPFPTRQVLGSCAASRRDPEQREAAARRARERVDAAVRELAAVSRRMLPGDGLSGEGERTEQWREQILAVARRLVADRAAALMAPQEPSGGPCPGSAGQRRPPGV